jgi:hypothetical protein
MDSIDNDTRTDKSNVKVKRILAKRQNKGSFLYLVQMIGEPAQNSKWMSISELPKKAQEPLFDQYFVSDVQCHLMAPVHSLMFLVDVENNFGDLAL